MRRSGEYGRAPDDPAAQARASRQQQWQQQQGGGEDDFGCDQLASSIDNPGILFAALAGVCVLAAVAMMSLSAVPPLMVGIRYNQFSKAADTTTIYGPGRYFVGPFNKFLLFPSSVQTIEFSDEPALQASGIRYEPLHTRTKEGLGLHLQVSLQYRLIHTEVGKLYSEFNQNYEQVFTSSVRDVLIKAASEYEASQLWHDRVEFQARMQTMINTVLKPMYGECWGLQLLIINLPDTFESSIVTTQVQGQSVLMREQEQVAAQIRAHTGVIEAEFNRSIKVINAGGIANYTVTTKQASALAQRLRIDTEAEIMRTISEQLGIRGDALVLYQKYGAFDDLENSTIFFNFGGPSTVLAGGS